MTSAGGRAPNPAFAPDIDIALTATPADVQIFGDKPTRVWTYQSKIVRGAADSAQPLPQSYAGPIIRVKRGQKARITFNNNLPSKDERSIIHWHGLMLPEDMDGHPRFAIAPGQSYAYEFEVSNRAGTYWFHPHPHGRTAPQVYNGLAGLFIVSDDEEAALGLPSGEFDMPLILQDRTFDKANQLVYFGEGMMGGMMEQMMGFLGEHVLVNGRPDFELPVAARAYRLRILNGSNARIYKLAWSDGAPLMVIGTDGGLLEKPVRRSYVMLSPGERVELWADFSRRSMGDVFTLDSLEFFGAEDPAEEMKTTKGGSSSGDATRLGAPMKLMTVRVTKPAAASPALPSLLTKIEWPHAEGAINFNRPRMFELKQQNTTWKINGRSFEMDQAAADETVKANALEVWDVVNAASPGEQTHTLGMAHPFHIHGVQFKVIARKVRRELQPGYDTVREGFVDEGWKDTVLVMPGERVQLLMRMPAQAGLFVYHCHNLEHEDMGMMRNYRVLR